MHDGDDRLHEDQRGDEIEVQQFSKVIDTNVFDFTMQTLPGIVYQRVDPPEVLDGRLHSVMNLIGTRDITRHG
ncbi:hypothetical protein BJF93_21570 [Xaviernesmea oryzae]|uniref:Uncharacterized protein n=1 Tax=Xaviernesmea oryzae TaxID=464029 RepID=A0A1Q9B3X5_9HYPH|nr:hypothetical protein BJF93_21570 [Xaviernesmea oryzae]